MVAQAHQVLEEKNLSNSVDPMEVMVEKVDLLYLKQKEILIL